MRDDVTMAINQIRGLALRPAEVDAILKLVSFGTHDERDNDLDLEEALILGGLRLSRNRTRRNRVEIARKWLVTYGVPVGQLDELIVMAKLTREDE